VLPGPMPISGPVPGPWSCPAGPCPMSDRTFAAVIRWCSIPAPLTSPAMVSCMCGFHLPSCIWTRRQWLFPT